jgi:signal peptidase I
VASQAQLVYNRGDFVRLNPETSPAVLRVVALPGDRLLVDKAGLRVDGVIVTGLSPEFLSKLDRWDQVVPPKHFFLVGEEQANQLASKFWGLIPAGRIVAKVQR